MSDTAPLILLVDDDQGVLQICATALTHEGYRVATVPSGQAALAACASGGFAVAVLDLVLPDIDGLTLLSSLREADPDLVAILMTGHASLDTAIDAVRRGAYDYLRKPFGMSDLIRVVSRGLSQRELTVQNRELLRELDLVNQELTQKVTAATTELTAFISLGRNLGQSGESRQALLNLLNAALQITGATTSALFTGAGGADLQYAAGAGPADALLRMLRLPASDPLAGRALDSGGAVTAPALLEDPQLACGPLALLGFSAAMALPVKAITGATGLLLLLDPSAPFTERHASLVKVVAAQMAEVVALARLTETPPAADDSGRFVDLRESLGVD